MPHGLTAPFRSWGRIYTIGHGSLPSSVVWSPKKLGRPSAHLADSTVFHVEGKSVTGALHNRSMKVSYAKQAVSLMQRSNDELSPESMN